MSTKYQEKYWQELYTLMSHVNYLEIYLMSSEKIDKSINAFLAIASSSSIAGWVIWKEYQFLWASIIVVSQLINAIKIYLPYNSRIKSINKILKELEVIVIEYEEKWYDVSEGKFTEEQIHKLQFEMKKHKSAVMQKYFDITVLPENKKYLAKAESKTSSYLKNYY